MTDGIMQAAAVSDMVLPSYEDEADWFGDASPTAALDRYRDAGADCVVVKNGPHPIIYTCDGQTGEDAVDRLGTVVDTTAAGDSFNVRVIAGYAETQDIRAGIETGCALARWVVSHQGALVPMDGFSVRHVQPC